VKQFSREISRQEMFFPLLLL